MNGELRQEMEKDLKMNYEFVRIGLSQLKEKQKL
jgi:hypothetical protein